MSDPSPFELFRPEVRRSAHRRLDGEVILAIAPGATVFSALAVAATVGFGAFVAMASYSHTASIEGWLVPTAESMPLSATRGGVVEGPDTGEGRLARADQRIARADASFTAQPGERLATSRRKSPPLEVELFAPSRSAGMLRIGQDVRLYYNGFPHERFGAGHGRIVDMSDSALAPTDVPLPGLGAKEPVFRIRVSLDQPNIVVEGRTVQLRPGARLSGQVELERRTILGWAVGPLFSH